MPDFAARLTNVRMRDGLTNALTGAGTSTDPRAHNFYMIRRMVPQQIESAYRGGWVMRKIIDKPAREMVREWRSWEANPIAVKALEKAERKLQVRQKVEKALQLAGLGGAGMVLWIKGDDPTQPINPARIRKGDLGSIIVWHRSRFSLGEMITDPDDDWHGHPSYYQLNMRQGGPVQIHPSRVIAFKGQPNPDIATASWEEAFWGDSTVEVVLEAVANSDTAQNGFAALIKDARNRRVYVPKLLEKTATADGEAKMAKRMAAMALGESMFGVTWLDAGATNDDKAGERIEDRQMAWTGMPQLADLYMTAAAGAADMPATVLWGKSPDGMNSTGESDKDLWEQTIKGRQDLDAGPAMDQLDMVLIPSATGKQADAEGDDTISWEWRPLSTQTEEEEATTFWNFMQGFQILVDTNTLPAIAAEKMIQNKLIETRWFPGTDSVLNELDEKERFPSLTAPDPAEPDPSALVATGSAEAAKGGDPATSAVDPGAVGSGARRRAANDAKPRTLYVSRKVQNVAEIAAWAKAQGIADLNDDLHVTIAYSTTPVDWIKMGTGWEGDSKGNVTIAPGGPRVVEPLGNQTAVLMFASSDLGWRNMSMRKNGASWDWPDYQPHVSLTQAPINLSKVQPYTGKIVLGPEMFEEIRQGDQP